MNSTIKRVAATCAATTVLAGGAVLATTGTAQAADAAHSGGCVTKTEYRKVKKGMSPARVKQIFDTGGRLTYSYHGTYVWSEDRSYKPCYPFNRYSDVSVDFTKRHGNVVVDGKSSFWIHN